MPISLTFWKKTVNNFFWLINALEEYNLRIIFEICPPPGIGIERNQKFRQLSSHKNIIVQNHSGRFCYGSGFLLTTLS